MGASSKWDKRPHFGYSLQPHWKLPGRLHRFACAAWQTVRMPIYEYRCESCAERFEELVRRPDDTVACPQCGGTEAERLLSVFAGVGASGGAGSVPDAARLSPQRGLGGCCGGACGHMH